MCIEKQHKRISKVEKGYKVVKKLLVTVCKEMRLDREVILDGK